MKRCVPAILITSLVMAATFVSPAPGYAQPGPPVGVVGVVHPAVVIAPYYRPWFYDPFYYSPYYGAYAPTYGAAFDGESSLRLQVTPRETEVFVDGYFAGKVDDFDGFLQRLRLPPGEHILQLYLAGHRSVQQQIYLQPGKTFRVRYNLELLAPGEPAPERPVAPSAPSAPIAAASPANPSSAETGMLALRVQPGDAVVMIDGERWDGSRDADRLVVQLAPGVHRVEIRKEGYRPYSSDVTVRRGETEALNVALAR